VDGTTVIYVTVAVHFDD